METLTMTELLHCHICSADLQPHPLYSLDVAKTCTRHGDFFIYRERGKEPAIIFRSFQTPRERKPKTEKITPIRTPRVKKKKPLKPRRKSVPVRCDQNGVVYPSQCEAARVLGVGQSEISDHLRGLNKIVCGYTFTKMTDDGMGGLLPVPRPVVPRNSSRSPLKVKCNETGQIFDSIRQASEAMDIPKTTLRYRLHNSETYKVPGEYTFSFVTSQEKHGSI